MSGDTNNDGIKDSQDLSERLAAEGLTDVRYGLVAFGELYQSNNAVRLAHSEVVDTDTSKSVFDRLFSSGAAAADHIVDLSAALEHLDMVQYGGDEDGWDAIDHAIAEYDFRPGAVASLVLVQNQEGRINVNESLTHDGVLAALKSKNVILNSLVVGDPNSSSLFPALFDLEPYGLSEDIRVLGVEADEADGARDGVHDYHWVDTDTFNSTPDVPSATAADALQISYNGSNTGTSGMVATGKSILISKNFFDGIGPSAGGYSAKSVPFGFIPNMQNGSSPFGIGISHTFDFFGVQHTTVNANDNGTITFGSNTLTTETNVDLSRQISGQTRPTFPLIAALWDEFETLAGGTTVYWKKLNLDGEPGLSQNDLVIEWRGNYLGDNLFVSPDGVRFQAILFSDGTIRLNYIDLDSYPGYDNDPVVPDNDQTVYKTGGINATVGIWKGTSDPAMLPPGRFVPGLHSINGSTEVLSGELADTNDSYVRLAWDTGGAAWDAGIVSSFLDDGGINSPEANALRDAFVASLANQINEAAASGKVVRTDDPIMSIDFGTTTTVGANGFTGDTAGNRIAYSGAIDMTSNSIPTVGTPAGMQSVFQTARQAAISLNYATVPNGTYVVELFFADVVATTFLNEPGDVVFDVLMEGKTVLNDYDIFDDRGRIVAGPNEFELDVAAIGSVDSFVMPAAIVKRFLVDVSDFDFDYNNFPDPGLQIQLGFQKGAPLISALRILKADPPRVEEVVLKGSTWKNGVAYSYAEAVAAGSQLRPAYYQGVDRIEVHFDGPVNIPNGALSIRGNGGLPVSGVSATPTFDVSRRVATWTLPALPAGKFAIVLDGVTGAGGQMLDADWINITSAGPDRFNAPDSPRKFLSGDGTAGNNIPGMPTNRFEFFFSVLPGDSNQDGVVTTDDIGAGVTRDVNGDGLVNASDESAINTIASDPVLLHKSLIASRATGDYNEDEKVTVADYATWKAQYGDTLADHLDDLFLEADGNLDVTVDGGDYIRWRNNLYFGMNYAFSAWYTGPPPGGGSGGIPEVLFEEAPRVANVTIRGSNSTHPAYSFDAHDGSGEQLRTVPVGGADTVVITFTEDVYITANMLTLTGLGSAVHPAIAEFSYDVGTMTATWRFTTWTISDRYAISLADAVTDVDGNRLDGEWVNPISRTTTNAAVSQFPSGNGTAGGDFNFVFSLMIGDVDLDGDFDNNDFQIIYSHQGMVNAQFIDGDVNGNGVVTGYDIYLAVQQHGPSQSLLSILGDLNSDWVVDQLDADILYANWYSGLQNPDPDDGDLDGDHDIDINDLNLLLAQWGVELVVVS